jgi:hypothetical protein
MYTVIKLYYSSASMGERKGYKILVGNPEGKRPLGRRRRRWEDEIRIDLNKFDWEVEWIQMAKDKDRWRNLENTVMNLRVLASRS